MAVFTLPCQGNEAIGECISQIYTVSLTLVGIVAFVQIIWGGFLLLTAAGNTTKTGEAMNRIKNAVFGIVLLFSSYAILKTINPDLVKFNFALQKLDKEEKLANPSLPSEVKDFSISPSLVSLSENTLLIFKAKVFSSSQRISGVCGADAKELVARVDLLTETLKRKVVNFSNFSKENFGTREKVIPWSFSKETKAIANLLDSPNDDKIAKFEFILTCPNSNNFIFRSSAVTVNIAP